MVVCADVLEWVVGYDGPKFHALLSDPPYELGFMGKDWDRSGIAFKAETWAALAQHLEDGAFGMAFASARGWHRLAVAIEDAGLRIHPSIFGWSYGSGFPKATRVKDAPEFEGHRYGLQAMKPALEPIIIFQVPYNGKAVESITETGAGALWIDGGRIGTEDKLQKLHGSFSFAGCGGANETGKRIEFVEPGQGRWPANFHLVHHPECDGNGGCHPDCPARRLGEQSGERKSGDLLPGHKQDGGQGYGYGKGTIAAKYGGDTGTAARFFHQSAWALDHSDPVLYQAKASRKERNAGLGDERCKHPTIKPIELAKWLATLLLPPAEYAPRRLMVPFCGTGSEMIGAELVGWEHITGIEMNEDTCAIAEARIEHWLNQPKQLELGQTAQIGLLDGA
jgi:site-specific DNA-methyltransferase (adenine-specific)